MSATGQHERSLRQALRRNHLLSCMRNKTPRRVYIKLVPSFITRDRREKANYSAPAVRLFFLQRTDVYTGISDDNCDFTPSWLYVISPELTRDAIESTKWLAAVTVRTARGTPCRVRYRLYQI
jgi:hypothetical protein